MAKCRHNNVGSMISMDRHKIRLWSAFSFRRKLFDTLGCGGVSRQQQHYDDDDDEDEPRRSESSEKKQQTKLSEILKISESSSEVISEEVAASNRRRKVEMLEELQGVVKRLGSRDMSAAAASDVRRLTKADAQARETLAMLGAIPPLVGMLDSDSDSDTQISALYALLNLAIGNDMNKAAVVEAGAVHKMLNLLIDSPSSSVCEAMVANFLGLSALDSNKPIIGSSGAIPFLVKTLYQHLHDHTNTTSQLKHDCLRAIYNLSIFPPNVSIIILETDLVRYLLDALGDMEVSERILSILSNLISTPQGRKAISNSPEAFPILVDALNWSDSPGCQEKASYILMVMAHKGYGDRQAMVEAGVVSSLLELTLIGTTLAQRRASRILDCLSVDKGKQLVSENYHQQGGGGLVSAPIYGESTSSSSIRPNQQEGEEEKEDEEEMTMSEERKAVKQLVQLSLQNNMRRIVKRANLPQDFVPSEHFKSLATTSTSKSLPF